MESENDYGKKLEIYFKQNIPIHINTTSDKWLNGYIIEIGSTFAILDEFRYGRTLVFFQEIKVLDAYTKEAKIKDRVKI